MTPAATEANLAPMSAFDPFALDDLKLVYRALHLQLLKQTDLLDCEFFSELQVFLQDQAKADGVDVGDHGRWDAWLHRKSSGLHVVS